MQTTCPHFFAKTVMKQEHLLDESIGENECAVVYGWLIVRSALIETAHVADGKYRNHALVRH